VTFICSITRSLRRRFCGSDGLASSSPKMKSASLPDSQKLANESPSFRDEFYLSFPALKMLAKRPVVAQKAGHHAGARGSSAGGKFSFGFEACFHRRPLESIMLK